MSDEITCLEQLHKIIFKERYDIEIAYLEGPCARVTSGCSDPTIKKMVWIHIEQYTTERAGSSFRNVAEARACYRRFNCIVCASYAEGFPLLQRKP